jgi:hypothetical protein
VTGLTAGSKDFNDTMRANLPYVFAFVLGVAFLLLMWTFRSIVVPAKAIVLNLLSVGSAYGVLTLAFPDGIVAWLPLFLFVILFGLSMDYHVFILSRVREAVDGGMSTKDAVAHGVRATAGRGHQRGGGDDRRVRDLRHPRGDRVPPDGDRPGGRDPHRRDDHPAACCCPPHGPARRAQLVAPAPLRRGRLARPRQAAAATA